MKLAIMQPYFLPYIGYYQLIAAVDKFIIYDNIQYTKRGWINRNRLLTNNEAAVFSLPIKKGSDYLNVVQRELAPNFDRGKLLNQFRGAYARAPFFAQTFPLLERVAQYEDDNLFNYIHNSVAETCGHLGIDTKIQISSTIDIDHGLRSTDKVIALCKAVGADTYINPIGGVDIYDRAEFQENGLQLKFLKSRLVQYSQFGAPYVPWLSIVDVLMFNGVEVVHRAVRSDFDIVDAPKIDSMQGNASGK